jgi:hypothetical protein
VINVKNKFSTAALKATTKPLKYTYRYIYSVRTYILIEKLKNIENHVDIAATYKKGTFSFFFSFLFFK